MLSLQTVKRNRSIVPISAPNARTTKHQSHTIVLFCYLQLQVKEYVPFRQLNFRRAIPLVMM
jgi:hypothetical protein